MPTPRENLQALLNEAAANDNGIDGVFIVYPDTGTIMMKSEVPGFTGNPNLDRIPAWIGRLANVKEAMNLTGYGKFNYVYFPIETANIMLFFEATKTKGEMIIGFIGCGPRRPPIGSAGEIMRNAPKYVHGYSEGKVQYPGIVALLDAIPSR